MIEYIGLSSMLILAVLVLRALVGGRISQRVKYGLWFLVALRLLIPFQVGTSALSAVPVLREIWAMWSSPADGALSGGSAGALPAAEENDRPEVAGDENGQSGTTGEKNSPLGMAGGKSDWPDVPAGKDDRPGMADAGNGHLADVAAAGKTVFGFGKKGIIGGSSAWIWFFLWLSGAVSVGGCFLWANLRFWFRLKNERYRLPDVPGYLPIYGASCVRTPCLYGMFRAAIYLPSGMAETILMGGRGYSGIPVWNGPGADRRETGTSAERLAHILVHEQTHYSHRDHIWAFVRCLCLTVHWYNPLVWAAAKLSRRDSELACDEGAVRRLGEANRKAYGATLIEVAAGEWKTAGSAICFTCLWNGKKEMEKRLYTLVRHPRTTVSAAVFAAVFVALLTGCAFSNPAGNGSDGDGDGSQPDVVSLTGDDTKAEKDDGASGQGLSGGEEKAGQDAGEIYLLDEPVEGKVCIAVNPVNIHPPTGRCFHIPHQEGWRSNWEEATGYGPENAYIYYFVPDDSVQGELQQMMAELDETKSIPEDSQNGSRMIGYSLWYEGKTWDVYEDGSLYWYQSDDDTLEVTEAVEENAALCGMVAGLLKEKLGYEPVDLNQIQDITSATMVYTERRGSKEGVSQSQTVTDPEVLHQIEKLIRQARYLHGGSGCSFYEAVLTVTLASGEEIRMAVASDSCAVFLVNGVYYDYQPEGDSGQLFRYFDRISVYGLEDEADKEKTSDGDEP